MAYLTVTKRRKLLARLVLAVRFPSSSMAREEPAGHDAEGSALHLAANVPSSLFALLQDHSSVKSVF